MTGFDIPHGTTVVAVRYADGVVMAGDRRATAGYMIASRRIDIEMLLGMASGQAAAVRQQTGGLLLYTPVVHPDDFEAAISYLARNDELMDLVRGRALALTA